MSDMQKNMMKSKLPPLGPRNMQRSLPGRKDYSPLDYRAFFHDIKDVKIDESVFRCYRTIPIESSIAPVLVLLHGGGYNGLSWAVFSVSFIITRADLH